MTTNPSPTYPQFHLEDTDTTLGTATVYPASQFDVTDNPTVFAKLSLLHTLSSQFNVNFVVGTHLYAVEHFSRAGDQAAYNIAKFDGKQWYEIPAASAVISPTMTNDFDHALLYANRDLFVGGNFTKINVVA